MADNMTLDEAKAFYMRYKGYGFHMGREDPSIYESYRSLHIDKTRLRDWDEELLDELFRELCTEPEHAWITHGHIIDIIKRGNCDVDSWSGRLLDEMSSMGGLDARNKILIIENMAGRSTLLDDGGVYLFCEKSSLGKKMKTVMSGFMDFRLSAEESLPSGQPGWDNIVLRFDNARADYYRACGKWCNDT